MFLAYHAAAALHLLGGDWAKAGSSIERAIEVFRAGNIVTMLTYAVAASSMVLAQTGAADEALIRLREGERLLERHAARGVFGQRGGAYHSLGCAGLLLCRLDEARRFADWAIESSPKQPGYVAHALHLLGRVGAA
jgi:tetratricopeptide (TPR) repeat protein